MDELYAFCKEKDILFMVDEIQTGVGRTGKFFCYEHYNIKPDVITLAKALGGGLPLGAVIVHERLKDVFGYGAHGSTFGGNLLACASGLAAIDQLTSERFGYINKMSEYLTVELEKLQKKYSFIKNIRGKGLLIGVEVDNDIFSDIVIKGLEKGFILNVVQNKVLRFLPSYFIEKQNIDDLMLFLDDFLQKNA